ncbi:MAG: HNH endonuclease signature motif containing protein [Nitriliruptoraceae bacterium]
MPPAAAAGGGRLPAGGARLPAGGGRPAAEDPVAATTVLPERAPHPADDPAWRYVHDLDDPAPRDDGPPFGLPVLAELPALGTVLEQLRHADQLIARALEGILLLQDHADVAATTGVGLESWLTTIARRTRTDARMLLAAAEMLRRLPSLRAAFQQGQASWAQVRAVALKARPLPSALDDRVDAAVAAALDGAGGAEPDALTRVIAWSLAALHPERTTRVERTETAQEFLALQPRLDGSGGRLWGELGATSWAVLDAALHPAGGEPGTGAAGDDAPTAAPDGREQQARADDADEPSVPPDVTGRHRARRLVALLESTLPGATGDATASRGAAAGSRPQLLLRADLDTLLGREETPATLLTTLLGGHVHVSANTARRMLDERGADLRTVVLDDTGSVVGVGRRHRLAPGWLSDAVLALHDTCSAPGCLAAARGADLDHAQPWWPTRPEDVPGTTDVRQLAPLCPVHNRGKERDGWTVEQTADGRRRWIHARSGLTTDTLPATWRPGNGHAPTTPPAAAVRSERTVAPPTAPAERDPP